MKQPLQPEFTCLVLEEVDGARLASSVPMVATLAHSEVGGRDGEVVVNRGADEVEGDTLRRGWRRYENSPLGLERLQNFSAPFGGHPAVQLVIPEVSSIYGSGQVIQCVTILAEYHNVSDTGCDQLVGQFGEAIEAGIFAQLLDLLEEHFESFTSR